MDQLTGRLCCYVPAVVVVILYYVATHHLTPTRMAVIQIADALEYELPSDLSDDEEIDEETAFTEADKKKYAGMFGDTGSGGDDDNPDDGQDEGLLLDSEASEDESLNADVRFNALSSSIVKGSSMADCVQDTVNNCHRSMMVGVFAAVVLCLL